MMKNKSIRKPATKIKDRKINREINQLNQLRVIYLWLFIENQNKNLVNMDGTKENHKRVNNAYKADK